MSIRRALDYLGSDPETGAIVMIIETLRDRGELIAAARAAARNKPILAMKIDCRSPARAMAVPTQLLAGPDAVYDAVFAVRVCCA